MSDVQTDDIYGGMVASWVTVLLTDFSHSLLALLMGVATSLVSSWIREKWENRKK